MSEIKDNEKETQEEYYLNDDRRVKVLSPGALVAKRFFRNRVAVVGLIILAVMFVFSFIGGLISPYGEKDFFYRNEGLNTPIGGAKENTDCYDCGYRAGCCADHGILRPHFLCRHL